ncbi:DEAD/DEAH box helicase family protein [Candidatus Poriferisocius sp.]|uniref:restriction endonuclease n=1 Tax=Candidatus Poriferisocius sp. TaxID=3101276 RepID=UPI003B029A9A
MAYLAEALEVLRQRSEGNQARKGRSFEILMRQALATHTGEYGTSRFTQVWLWSDWPARDGPDHGIDIVAEQVDGTLCAIQCKFYAPSGQIPAKDIDSFLAASEGRFASRILIATAELPARGRKRVESASPRCELLAVADMDEWVTDWREYLDNPDALKVNGLTKHTPRADQQEALANIAAGFEHSDRGKVILPCGTGKSVLAMWAAENLVGRGGSVLYLVPSISLMGQTMREWARHKTMPHTYLGVCSDHTSGRRDDDSGLSMSELAMPVSTDAGQLAEALEQPAGHALRVVFSTYQSAKVVADAQLKSGVRFDLAVCDEAHRTTGLAAVDRLSIDDPSGFTLIHQKDRLVADRRLFMTATPRVYTEQAKKKAARQAERAGYGFDVDSYCMDDEKLYGPVFHQMSFADAIDQRLLSDYQVLVIAVSDTPDHRYGIASGNGVNLSNEQAVKLLGCWDALADPTTRGVGEHPDRKAGMAHSDHARSAIAFTNTVKVSKTLAECWPQVVERHTPDSRFGGHYLNIEVNHIDGSTPALRRGQMLQKLKDEEAGGRPENSCRVLTNARVLTEGVDVPALDSIIFFERRTSKIDITQAVGRVMRRAPGKEIGRVVIPVVVPEGKNVTDQEVLNGSDFKVVWDVVRALRSHDERIDYWINHPKTVAKKDKVRVKVLDSRTDRPEGEATDEQLQLIFAQVKEAVASKLVEMCGDRRSWITWGEKAAGVCRQVHDRVEEAVNETAEARHEFDRFVEWMRATLNPSVGQTEAAEMVAQHIVTMPVFDHMFAESRFAELNPVSRAIQKLLEVIDPEETRFEVELEPLKRAYDSMNKTFDGAIDSAERVDILRQVYEGFFHHAMADTVKRLGIVYTPVELVDFILRSADAVCKQEFGKGLGAAGVNVLDPFSGTGTFIYRLLTGTGTDGEPFISDDELTSKYEGELHANEIVLLAYYIAALKIEAGYSERRPDADYREFPGIVFGDTFLLSDEVRQEQLETMRSGQGNSERGLNQATTQIQVIVANPPWSAGQKSAGDDNPNQDYEEIAERVQQTYGKRHREVTGRGAGKASGNLYVQAIRWASDRLDEQEGGIIAIVHPNSLLNATSLAGMRAALRDEFTDIYVVNLRGNAYTSGEEFRREGDQIFGPGSRNGVQITVLVRNPAKEQSESAVLHYAEVPEGQLLEAKFAWLEGIGDVTNGDQFVTVPINVSHDWVNLSDGSFDELLAICDTNKGNREGLIYVTSQTTSGLGFF